MPRILGEPPEEWLNMFRRRIETTLKTERFDETLVDKTNIFQEETAPDYIWRFKVEEQDKTTLVSSKIINVTPLKVEVRAPLNTWIAHPNSFALEAFLDSVAKIFAIKEGQVALSFMLKEAHQITSTQRRATKKDIQNASTWIRENGHYADHLLINGPQYIDLSVNREIIEKWEIDQNFARQQGKDFCGLMNGLKVYLIPFIPKQFMLVYEKGAACLKRTPWNLRFDNYNNPKELVMEEYCIAWFTEEGTAAKVCFNPP